jgi:YegS/Rv2252/BmrU family lipid kinase
MSAAKDAGGDAARAALATVPYLVVNPKSAAGRTGRHWAKLEREARSALGDVRVGMTADPMHATTLAREALLAGHRLVLAVGGDGTLGEVVNGFFGPDGTPVAPGAAVGLLPRGTGGDFRKTALLPREFGEAARRVAVATVRPIDVGRVRFRTHEGGLGERYFLNVASFGVSGQVAKEVNRTTKAFGGLVSFYIASFKAMMRYRDRPVRIRVDDGPPEEVQVTTLAVANGQYFGGGMKVAPGARLDDGLFSCTLWGGYGIGDFVFRSGSIYSGRHVEWGGTRTFTAKKLEVESDFPLLMDVDGEGPGMLPATFEILPGAVGLKA